MRGFIGVDVGAAGGIAAITESGEYFAAVPIPETDGEILSVLNELRGAFSSCQAALEKVHSSPQMGVVSAFSFGGSYRALRMALCASLIPFVEVQPQTWQRQMECMTGGDKNVTKLRAMQMFPGVKISHAIADALLIAAFCRESRIG